MLAVDWRLEGWKAGRSQGISSSHFASGNVSHCDQIFPMMSAPTRQALSLVPVSSVVIALASAIVLALFGWPCLLDSRNFTFSCYSSRPTDDSGFLLLLISGLSCHPQASFLSHVSPVKPIPNVKSPRLVYVHDWTLTDTAINSGLDRLCLRLSAGVPDQDI